MSAGGAGAPPLAEGYSLIRLATVDSTMTEAARRAEAGAPDGTLVWAAEQTAGRGRRGRGWESPPGGNLYLSVLIWPELPPQRLANLGFAAGLALHAAIAPFLRQPEALRLKWPNDLLYERAKLAGLLLESQLEPDGRARIVVGMGVNLAAAPQHTPYPAAALSALPLQRPVDLAAAVAAWTHAFAPLRRRLETEGFAAIRADWLAKAAGRGERITARLADGRERNGVFADLDGEGRLLLRLPDGSIEPIAAGDVYFREDAGHAAGH